MQLRFNSTKFLQENHQEDHRETGGIFNHLNYYIAEFEIQNTEIAKLLTKLIPDSCPFERDIRLFGHTVFHIPPLCKLNPLYESLMILRFRALTLLSE